MDFSTPTIDLIKSGLQNAQTVNSDQVLYNRIKESGDSKEQLRKAAVEFESIFITKMLSEMDKTVDRENGLFGKEIFLIFVSHKTFQPETAVIVRHTINKPT